MIEIDCVFPGGNIVVDAIENDTVRLRPDLRDTDGHWFYWCFRVHGAAGRTLRFVFESDDVGVRGPGVSSDGGHTWTWLGQQQGDGRSFAYAFPEEASEVRFSFGMPYLQADLDAFLAARTDRPHLRARTLCRSRKGRPVKYLSVGRLDEEPEHRVLVACRHHACEMMASYVLEGLVDAILSEDETGKSLRQNVEFMVLPFVDKDGVEDGDQGKQRRPHDHNRDYAAPCLYPEVRALRERVPAWAQGRMTIALDLHCPGHRGELHELIHFVGMPDEEIWARLERFSETLEAAISGPLPYRRSNNLPFGVDWNTEADPPGAEPQSFSDWMCRLPGVRLGATLEIPYANAQDVAVTADTARAFGRDLAAAIRHHLAQQ